MVKGKGVIETIHSFAKKEITVTYVNSLSITNFLGENLAAGLFTLLMFRYDKCEDFKKMLGRLGH